MKTKTPVECPKCGMILGWMVGPRRVVCGSATIAQKVTLICGCGGRRTYFPAPPAPAAPQNGAPGVDTAATPAQNDADGRG